MGIYLKLGGVTTREEAFVLWWLHGQSLRSVIRNWWKVRRYDAETVERMVRLGREVRRVIRAVPAQHEESER